MPTKAEQREYLERKLREFFSQTGQYTEPPKPPVQSSKEVYAPSRSRPVKQETPPPEEDDFGDDILKRIESLW